MMIYLLSPPSTPRFIRSARWEAADRGGTTYYPLWLSYTTGVLEERYKEVRLVDAQVWGWSVDDVVNDVKKFNPDLVVVDCAFSSLMSDIKVAETIKKNIKKDVKTRTLSLIIPEDAKYIKISDIYTLKNVKDNLILKPSGSK